jgi:hypothetical protein
MYFDFYAKDLVMISLPIAKKQQEQRLVKLTWPKTILTRHQSKKN